jgi:hypothetical protein
LPGIGCLLIASPRHSAEPIDEAGGGGVEDAPWNPVCFCSSTAGTVASPERWR